MKVNVNHIKAVNDNSVIIQTYNSVTDFQKRDFFAHHHSMIEISLVEYGSGVYCVSDTTYEFQSGDIFLFSTNEIHYITEVYETCSFITLQFEPRFLWNFNNIETDTEQLLGIFFNRSSSFSNLISHSDSHSAKLIELIRTLQNEMCEKKVQYESMVRSILINLLVHIARNYDYINTLETDKYIAVDSMKVLDSAMNYINNHLTEDINLEEIAHNCHLNKSYFSTLFKKLNGMSPWEYITLKRVERSIHLLKTTSLSTLEISQMCGFNTPSNFYRAFKKLTSQTPQYYKKSLKSGQ